MQDHRDPDESVEDHRQGSDIRDHRYDPRWDPRDNGSKDPRWNPRDNAGNDPRWNPRGGTTSDDPRWNPRGQ